MPRAWPSLLRLFWPAQRREDFRDDSCAFLWHPLLTTGIVNVRHPESSLIAFGPFKVAIGVTCQFAALQRHAELYSLHQRPRHVPWNKSADTSNHILTKLTFDINVVLTVRLCQLTNIVSEVLRSKLVVK